MTERDEFINFLRGRGAYEKWRFNMKASGQSEEKLFSERPRGRWITAAFRWCGTPEGHDYWKDLHSIWFSRHE